MLLGINIYLRFINIRRYRVAPSIKLDNDFNCKVEHGDINIILIHIIFKISKILIIIIILSFKNNSYSYESNLLKLLNNFNR